MARSQKVSNTFLLRLPLSIKEDAVRFSRIDGTSLNHFISLAVAEKITRLEVQPQPAVFENTSPRQKITRDMGFILRKTS